MGFQPFIKSFPIISPYKEQDVRISNWRERIDEILKLHSVNVILIDGRTRSGKSRLAKFIAYERDPNFKRFWSIKDIISYAFNFENDRWIILEEPQLEANRLRFWDDRNLVLSMFISAYGFTNNHLIMTLPNIKGISDMLLTNVSLRITVVARLNNKDQIVRKAYFKKALWNEKRQKYIWTTVEEFTIPNIDDDPNYEEDKRKNFMEKLKEWDKRLNDRTYEETQTWTTRPSPQYPS